MFKKILLNLLFPKKCYGCSASDTWLCSKCLESLQEYQGEIPRAMNNRCDLIIAGQYQDPVLNKLIIDFKFGGNQELSKPLSKVIIKELDKKITINSLTGNNWGELIIIPVPLHIKRKKWRGFNQSELLAKELSNYYNWPISLKLIKFRKTAIQSELSEEKRLDNQKNAFKWTGANFQEQAVLLIDDVITSGATLNEVELALIKAGAKRVIKIALAKG
jgi:competence protein ComFC